MNNKRYSPERINSYCTHLIVLCNRRHNALKVTCRVCKTYQRRHKEFNLSSPLGNNGRCGEPLTILNMLKRVQEGSVFNRQLSTRTRVHNLKLGRGKVRSNVKTHYFERVIDTWNKLSAHLVGKSTVRQHALNKHIYSTVQKLVLGSGKK